jgi:ribose transport system ATP-binding protein/rhamnose transport system ATP-binding protein
MLGLPTNRLDASLLTFSGGMQQKVIIARWLLVEPKILILDEPTKGVDIGTRSSIYGILRDIADAGVAIVLISSDFEELLGVCERVVVVSDGMTIANLPSSSLNEEKLTLLAAPRTSSARNTQLLRDLSTEFNGSAFWALLDDAELICLGCVTAPNAPDIGMRAGEAAAFAETPISQALQQRDDGFVSDGAHNTLLVPMRNRRGHDLGWVGLTLHAGQTLPDAASITARVGALVATDEPTGNPS